MASPFPGMDPYIEALGRWPGFHMDFIVRCIDQLNERLPDQYVATIGERIELIDEQYSKLKTQITGPDVAVIRDRDKARAVDPAPKSLTATLTPRKLKHEIEWLDFPKQLYIEITHLPTENVVTDIELLSPSNKRAGSEDRLAYLTKRKNLLVHRVNVVEYDFLLGGARLPLPEPLPAGDYFAFVTCGPNWHEIDVYGWSVRDPLPTLPVPLLDEDGVVQLDLAAAFKQTYEHGRYGRLLRYDESVPLALADVDRTWAQEVIASVR